MELSLITDTINCNQLHICYEKIQQWYIKKVLATSIRMGLIFITNLEKQYYIFAIGWEENIRDIDSTQRLETSLYGIVKSIRKNV